MSTFRPPRRMLCALPILASLAALLPASPATAHAVIVESRPAAGGTATAADPVLLRFNSRVDKARSRLMLVGPDGQERALAVADAGGPNELVAAPPTLAPGSYRLRWQVLAVDGHMSRGEIPFRVPGP